MSDNLPLAADEANRHYDIERRLHVRRTPITKACVNGYSGAEIMAGAQNGASLSLDKDRIYNLLRDPDELQRRCPPQIISNCCASM